MKKDGEFWSAVKWGLGLGLGIVTIRLVVEALSGSIPLVVDYLTGKQALPGSTSSTSSTLPPQLGG